MPRSNLWNAGAASIAVFIGFYIHDVDAAGCSCIGTAGLTTALGSNAFYTMNGMECLPVKLANGKSGCYPTDYGARCKAWDDTLPLSCANMDGLAVYDRPEWCSQKWCYVDIEDPAGCGPSYPSYYFKGLSYSYDSCGSKNTFNGYMDSSGGANVLSLTSVLHSYVKSTVKSVVAANAGYYGATCNPVTGCSCVSCADQSDGAWMGSSIDTSLSGYFMRKGTNGEMKSQCMAGSLHGSYEHIAATEGAGKRLGYMYFGSQADGSLTQWPAMEWCPVETDFRFRPWYSSAASGPKDVILVIDTSGSMGSAGRIGLARTAAKAVIDTLVDSDFAAIVKFNTDSSSNVDSMQPMTDSNKRTVTSWIESNIQPGGITNFEKAFQKAFDILKTSRSNEQSSNCKSIILFLSDGDPSDFSNCNGYDSCYDWLQAQAGDTVIFTYGLGSGLTDKGKAINKQIACSNRGIYHEVGDSADLGTVMSKYYAYFAVGTDSAKLRWRQYTDTATGSTLLAACLPSFDKSQTPRALLGVSCIDMNTLTTLEAFRSGPGYAAWSNELAESQKFCAPFRISHLDIQLLRYQYAETSVCDSSSGYNAACGDGIVDANGDFGFKAEECDDGNAQNGDGCSSTCQIEAGFVCPRFGYINNGGAFLQRPQLVCSGEDFVAGATAPGSAVSGSSSCRKDVGSGSAACETYCTGEAGCNGFNFFPTRGGDSNVCCFRTRTGTYEINYGTTCYEKLPTAGQNCIDTASFVDELDFKCHEWQGYDCNTAVSDYGYTQAGENALVAACLMSCGVCSGSMCRVKCSYNVATPAECKDCVGAWADWSSCASESIVVKPGGSSECLQERSFSITKALVDNGASCDNAQGDKDYQIVSLFSVSDWGSCMGDATAGASALYACGAGTRTRSATCVAKEQSLCDTYKADFANGETAACASIKGCAWVSSAWEDCVGDSQTGMQTQTRQNTCGSKKAEDCGAEPTTIQECPIDIPVSKALGQTSSVNVLVVMNLLFCLAVLQS